MMLLLALLVPWAANAQTSLWSEDFEGGSMPAGWTTDGPGSWSVGVGDYSTSTGAGHGSYNAKITHGSTGNVTKLITPEIDLSTVASAELSFMHIQRSWSGDIDELRVYYRTSSSEAWTMLQEYTNAYGSWTTEEGIALPNPSSTYQIAFEHTDNYGYGLGIDAVSILPPATCPKPTGLNVALTPGDGTVATLSWTSDADAWQICLNGDETNLIPATTNPYTLTGLTPETTYTAKVRANCGSEQSDWSNVVTFTPTNAYQITVNDGTTTNGYVPIYGYYVDNITKSQFIIPAENLANMAWGTINKMTFYAAADKNWGNAQFEVYMTETSETTLSALADYGTMTKVKNAGSLSISGNVMEVILDAPYQYTGGNLMIGFLQTVTGTYSSCSWYGVSATGASMGGYGSSISQQNFLPKTTFDYEPGEAPACVWPTGLTVSNVGGHSATLSWTSDGNAWQIGYSTDGFATEQYVEVTENPYTLTGLTPETAYQVRVQTNCGSGVYSIFTNPVSFTTDVACPAPTGLTASNITGHEATINWTSAAEAWQICVNDDEENLIGTTDTTYTLTGLAPETAYTVKVRANCGDDGYSDWTDNVSFTTDIACPTPTNLTTSNITANSAVIAWTGNDDAASYNLRYATGFISDFFEDFENGIGQWTVVRSGEGDENTDWHVVNSNTIFDNEAIPAHSGNYVVMSRSYNGSAYNVDNWLISPQVNIGSTMTYWVMDDGQYHEHYDIYVSTTTTDISAFTKVYEPGDASAEWTEVTVDLSAYDGQTGYVAFRLTDYDKDFIFIDDITITFPSTVTVDWTTVNDVTSPYTIEGLTPETKYTAAVQAVYADGISAWASTTFTTLALDAIPLNLQADVMATTATLTWDGAQDSYNVRYRSVYYYNSFNTDEDRAGWSYSSAIYGVDDTVYDIPASSNYFLAMGWSTTAEEVICSPALPAYPSGSTLEFYHFYLNEANTFQVGYSTTTNDATAFTWSNPIAATVSYQNGAYTVKYSQVLPDGVKYVAFKATASSQAACIFIDNFKIYKGAANNEWEETVSNVNARTLAITGLTPETEYEWQVQGNMTNGTTEWSERAFFTTMDVIIWNNPDDWTVPETYADVTIPANTQVIVPSGYTAYADEITIEEGGQITIEEGGELLHSNAVPVTMLFSVNGYNTGAKDNNPDNDGYILFALPLQKLESGGGYGWYAPVPVSETGMNTGDFDLYYFEQAYTLEWRNFETEEFGFNLGQGYLYANGNDITPTLAGTAVATTNRQENLQYTSDAAFAGWNLLGNPYTATAYIDRPFYVLNNDGDEVENEAHTAGEPIGVFQGFFVKADATGDVCNFSTVPYGGGVGLNMTVNQGRSKKDNAIITFGGGQNLEKFQLNPNHTKVYMAVDGKDYAIVDAPEMGEMPVSFKAETSGTYTLSFSNENVSFGYLRLIDNLTGVETDLLETPNYTFNARTTDYANRFRLVFATSSNDGDSFAYFNNGNLVINNEGQATLQMVDVMGRILRSESINGCASISVKAAPGVYMLRLINGNDVKVQKVIIK